MYSTTDKNGMIGGSTDKNGTIGHSTDKNGMIGRSTDKKGTIERSTDKNGTIISSKDKNGTIACSVPSFLLGCTLRRSRFRSVNTIFHVPVQQAGERVLLVTPLIQTDEGWQSVRV